MVQDGHGVQGHLVSSRIVLTLQWWTQCRNMLMYSEGCCAKTQDSYRHLSQCLGSGIRWLTACSRARCGFQGGGHPQDRLRSKYCQETEFPTSIASALA